MLTLQGIEEIYWKFLPPKYFPWTKFGPTGTIPADFFRSCNMKFTYSGGFTDSLALGKSGNHILAIRNLQSKYEIVPADSVLLANAGRGIRALGTHPKERRYWHGATPVNFKD